MISGLKALFTSGVILHPMVLLGIFAGGVFTYKFDLDTIVSIFSYYDYYMVAASIAFLYTIFFDMMYKPRGYQVDWKGTMGRVFGSFVKLVLANFLSISFLYFIGGF